MPQFETIEHGKFTIKIGPAEGRWGANAYRGKHFLTKARGDTRDNVLADVRRELDELEKYRLSELDFEGAPSSQVYERGFSAVLPTLADGYRKMLSAHFRAPDYLITATQLADAAGYAGYEGANLHYGKLGKRLAEEIDFSPPTRPDGTEIWTCAIARPRDLDPEHPHTSMLESLLRNMNTGHFEWQLRPQVVQALTALRF